MHAVLTAVMNVAFGIHLALLKTMNSDILSTQTHTSQTSKRSREHSKAVYIGIRLLPMYLKKHLVSDLMNTRASTTRKRAVRDITSAKPHNGLA